MRSSPALIATVASLCFAAETAHAADPRPIPKGARVTLEHGDARVGTYVSSPWGFSTNTHWIEGPDGIILIDTQFLPSAIEEAVAWIESATKKKIVLAIVLHPNPDKFNGTGFLKSRGIKVVTSDDVKKLIPEVHAKRVKWFYERYKPDYPKDPTLPDSFGAKTKELTAGGVTITAHVLGRGCSGAHVVVEFDHHLFTGDLVTNGAHSWFELGYPFDWLDRLQELTNLEPKFVHPGRGPSGGSELLVRERVYIERVVALASQPRAAPAELKKAVEEVYPGYRFAAFLELGLPAVIETIKAARERATITPIAPTALMSKVKGSKARVIAVNVWATWCGPCLEELPDLLRVYRKYRDRGFELVLFSADAPDARTGAEEILRQLGVDFPSYLKTGPDDGLIDAIDKSWSGALPATIILGKDRKKVSFTEGVITAETLETHVLRVLELAP